MSSAGPAAGAPVPLSADVRVSVAHGIAVWVMVMAELRAATVQPECGASAMALEASGGAGAVSEVSSGAGVVSGVLCGAGAASGVSSIAATGP